MVEDTVNDWRVRRSRGGRAWYVESPPDLTDGACYGRICWAECRTEAHAQEICRLLRAARSSK